ncbi:retrovirus-related pol polyprotein from transposon TNT 1-94 [Tanacetum coccineum]
MVSSLMYLTASRPDLVFDVCMCVSVMALTAYADADHAVPLRSAATLSSTPGLSTYDHPTPFILIKLKSEVKIVLRDDGLSARGYIHQSITKRAVRISTLASWNEEYVSGNPETSSGRRRGVKDCPPISYHKFHPRPGSPLHLPNEELILGYLKFSAKGTKWEVFGMPILNDLITDDIRGEQYYNAYLEKVAKHQTYLAGEEVSNPDSPAPKPAKATKPKASKQSKPLAPKAATKKPKPAPAKPQEKKRKLLVDEFVDEGVPENEPMIGDEEADLQKAVEESLKEVHLARQGPLPPVVIREPESGKFQPLLEVQGKGKEKVSDEQFALDLLTLQTLKKKTMQISLSSKDSETDSDEEVPGRVARVQAEGQAGPNPGDAAASQPPSSHVVHAGPNLEHMDLEASDTSIQPNPEQMDEEFTTTAYPNVQENLKLPTEGEEDEHEKTNTESEVQSMVTVPIHQDTFSVPLMTTPVIDLTVSQLVPTAAQAPLPTLTATATATTITTTTTLPLPPQP